MIDYFHAFDSISKDFMINAFQKFGFGVDFVKWVCVSMKDIKSCVSCCGWLSDVFAVEWNSAGLPVFLASFCSCC